MALFDGYTLRNVSGAVRFTLCAKSAEFTLAPGSSVTFRGQSIEGAATGLTAAGKPSFCDLPTIGPSGEARGAAEPPPDAPLSADRKMELSKRLQPIEQALSANPGDPSANAARIAVLQEFGLAAETRKAVQAMALLAPEATWTRGVQVNVPEPKPVVVAGKTYALLIGISTYKYDPPGSLRFADKDAELFAQLLEAPRGGGLKPPGDIRVLTNEDATRAAIDREAERLANENAASPGSNTLVLFIAGHGAYLKTEENPITHKPINHDPYIITYDANPQDAKTTGYPMDEARMLFCLGRALVFDRSYAAAPTLLERSIRLDPTHSYAYNALGIAYLEQIANNASNFDAAIHAFHDDIRFAPYWAYPRHNLALAFTQQGDYAAAIHAYRDAMAIGPQYSYLPYNLALLYQRLNELALAETYYQIAKGHDELNPHIVKLSAGTRWTERSEIWDGMGTLQTTRKRWSQAEADYRQALADDAQSLNAHHNVALSLSRKGKSNEAEDCWKRNLAANADHLPSLIGYGDYLARFGRPDEARALYERVTQLRPEYAGVHRKIAALWIQLGKLPAALAELRQSAQSSPDNPELLEQIATWSFNLATPAPR